MLELAYNNGAQALLLGKPQAAAVQLKVGPGCSIAAAGSTTSSASGSETTAVSPERCPPGACSSVDTYRYAMTTLSPQLQSLMHCLRQALQWALLQSMALAGCICIMPISAKHRPQASHSQGII